MSELLQGVFFVASVSGLIYKDHGAAGDISCVIVEGKRFYPATITELTPDAADNESRCNFCEDTKEIATLNGAKPCPHCR